MRCLLLIVISMLVAPIARAAEKDAPTTQPSRRVLIISVDGMRPDLLLRSKTPVMQNLMDHGTYTCWAQTTALAITLPSHVSMLTGVRPRVHQIEWNRDLPFSEPVYPKKPAIFELAKKAGYTTGLIAGKSKFDCLARPGTVDYLRLPTEDYAPDDVVKGWALEVIKSGAPQVLFVHLPTSDHTAHAKGWGSVEHRKAIGHADEVIGEILQAIDERHLPEPMLTIVTADHGGAGLTHGPDDPRSRHIPWIAVGPGVRQNVDLTLYPDLTVKTEDTFATACDFLKIPLAKDLDGKPVKLIYERAGQELLGSTTQPSTGS